MEEFKLLKNISGPADVKKLKKEELPQLADEIRQVLINNRFKKRRAPCLKFGRGGAFNRPS